jgi:outer membrane protein assembly factor BamB
MITRRTFVASALAAGGAGFTRPLHAATGPVSAPIHWPQFRGPDSRSVADGSRFPDQWSAQRNVAWKSDIVGRGWSSPVVWGDRVFLTTVVSQGPTEPPRKGLYLGGNRPEPPTGEHEWIVICLSLAEGRELWRQVVHRGRPATPIHVKNSYASETPVADAERLYVAFAGVGLFCFDHQGQKRWSHPLPPRPTRFGWGGAASPLLVDGRLVFVDDNEQASEIFALDAATGRELWRVPRPDEKSNWATPNVWRHGSTTQIITNGSARIRAYDLDGKPAWSMAGTPGIAIACPYAVGDLLIVSSGYVGAKLRPIYAVRPTAQGDITLPADATSGPHIAWCHWLAAPYNPTTLAYNGRLYVLHDRGLFACFHAATGRIIFDRQRIQTTAGFTASPWAADGKIYCLNEDGVTSVFKDADQFTPLHANALSDDDMGMATPAVAGDRLLIRTSARLYCIAPQRA